MQAHQEVISTIPQASIVESDRQERILLIAVAEIPWGPSSSGVQRRTISAIFNANNTELLNWMDPKPTSQKTQSFLEILTNTRPGKTVGAMRGFGAPTPCVDALGNHGVDRSKAG